jgi:predicted unusual protein kinase regulating ubiquinone biosynthesis (AarF/ABC1/UbiB family)
MNDDLNDNPQFFKKVGRSASLGGSVLGLATKLAGEKFLGRTIDRDVHSQELTQILGNLKGPIMKVGQILSTIPDALPPEYARAFSELQANAPSMGWPFVRRRMKAELGVDWQTKFTDFPQTATAAASLGQVHKAVTKMGETVACKLQYPDMASAVDADLRQLKILFSLYKQYDSSIKTSHIHDELAERLREELDYTLEARHQKLYAHLMLDEPNVHVPDVCDDLSTERLLTTKWADGQKILTYKESDIETRNQLALNMFRAWYIPLYKTGVIHGDPHLGNYSVRDDLSINLMDFGCVRIFRPAFVGGVIDLYNALKNDDRDLAVHAYKTWGFGDLNNEMIDVLNIWAAFLYGPILDDKVRTIGETNNGVYGREKAQEVHAKLKELRAGVPVPREFVFMDRAALGLGSVFIHLQAEVNWYQLFNEMIEGFSVSELSKRQHDILPQFGLKPAIE